MVYKEELTLYMEFEDEAVQQEIQERHRNGWVLTSRIGIRDAVFGPCAKLSFEKWHEQFDNQIFAGAPVYAVPYTDGKTIQGVLQ